MDKPLPIPEVKKVAPKVEDLGTIVSAAPAEAPPAKPYVDPFTEMYAGHSPDAVNIAARGDFSAQFFSALLQAHTTKVLENAEVPQISENQMRILAKQAVWGADLVLAELASTNNRRV